MTKDDLPRAFLPPKYSGRSKCDRNKLVAAADLGSDPLDLDDVTQVGRCVLGNTVKADNLSVSVVGSGPVHRFGSLFPSFCRRAEWIGDDDVIPL